MVRITTAYGLSVLYLLYLIVLSNSYEKHVEGVVQMGEDFGTEHLEMSLQIFLDPLRIDHFYRLCPRKMG